MNKKQAVKIAVAVMRKRIQRISIDANIYEKLPNSSYPYAEKAYKEKQQLLETIQILENSIDD